MYLLPHSSGDLNCSNAVVSCDSFDLGWCTNRDGSSAQHLKKAYFSLAHPKSHSSGQHTPACGKTVVVGFFL